MTPDAQLEEVLEWLWNAHPPAGVKARAREVLLDTVGCVIAAGRHRKVRDLGVVLAASDPGPVRVPGFAGRFSVHSAAALFAAAACWDEACEGLARAHGRPGVPVIAACAALGQSSGATLGDVLAAFVIGYETGGRLGEAMRILPGMHVDATWPGLGVAAAVVWLGGGKSRQALAAVHTAACQVPRSLYLPVRTGAEARNTYLAHSAQLGLLAGHTALAQLTSVKHVLEELRVGALAAPGEWLLLEGYLKPFAAVRHVHYVAAAALGLRPLIGSRLDDIRHIELATYAEALAYCSNRAPATPIQGQFSLTYGLACTLVTGGLDPSAYSEETLRDSRIREVEGKVSLVEDAELTRAARRGARLKVHLDGECLEQRVDEVEGDPSRPMPRASLLAKYARYTGQGVANAEEFLSAELDRPFGEALEGLLP